MFTIRQAQLDVLAADLQRRATALLVEHLATTYPERYRQLGEAGTLELIERAVETGAAYEITSGKALTALIKLQMQFGADFEYFPEPSVARELLATESLPADVKVALLSERLLERTAGRSVAPA